MDPQLVLLPSLEHPFLPSWVDEIDGKGWVVSVGGFCFFYFLVWLVGVGVLWYFVERYGSVWNIFSGRWYRLAGCDLLLRALNERLC